MRKIHCHIILLIPFLFSIVFQQLAFSQTYRFKYFTGREGLPQPYIYSIQQDDKGYLWIGTGEGLVRFDGFEFKTYTTENGLYENFVRTHLTDRNGFSWIGHNQGSISLFDGRSFTRFYQDSMITSTISDIKEDSRGNIWAVSQNGHVINIDQQHQTRSFNISEKQNFLTAIAPVQESNLLIGSHEGLMLWKTNPATHEILMKETVKILPDENIQSILPNRFFPDQYWIAADNSGLYQLTIKKDGTHEIKPFSWNDKLFGIGVWHIAEDQDSNLCIATHRGLHVFKYDQHQKNYDLSVVYDKSNGLHDHIQTVFHDREGNMWIGTYGNGLAMLIDEHFSFYLEEEDESKRTSISSVLTDGHIKWLGTKNGLLKTDETNNTKILFSEKSGFINDAVTALYKDQKDQLWIGTDKNGLYIMDPEKGSFEKVSYAGDNLSLSISDITGKDQKIWIATKGGIYSIDQNSGETNHLSTTKGLTHNNIHDLFIDSKGRIWAGARGNSISIINNEGISYKDISESHTPITIASIAEDQNGHIWLATYGDGIFKEDKGQFVQIDSRDGIKSNYCYSLIAGNNNTMWAGHKGGITRINTETYRIDIFDKNQGIDIDCNANATWKDEKGNVWFGTDNGAIKFKPRQYKKKNVPPVVNIKAVYLSDKEMPLQQRIEAPYNAYKLKIDFIGISLKQPEKVYYQYFLKGHDLEWSSPSYSNSAIYQRIEDGDYEFYIKACSADNLCTEKQLALRISVALPFWKRWWFYLLSGLTVAGLVWLVIRIRERQQKRIRRFLKNKLDLRTKEVIEKNKELEEKNKDITDSINYALKIQQSILPPKEILKDQFPESFILYIPRDIVSGDFYWFTHIKDRFMIACADCTGHGVPGAFMSIISNTVFKEVSDWYKETDPAKYLYLVDEKLKEILKQESSEEIQDGLDMVLCSIAPDKSYVEFSGAARPVLIGQDGRFTLFSNSRHSICGHVEEDKHFETKRVALKKGDTIYMFSDGYHDQFGGPQNKKMQVKGFVNYLKSIAEKPMGEQLKLLENNFYNWKGEREDQIDDVLIIGIRI